MTRCKSALDDLCFELLGSKVILCVNFRTSLSELELVEYGLLLSILGNIFLGSRNSLDLRFWNGIHGGILYKIHI